MPWAMRSPNGLWPAQRRVGVLGVVVAGQVGERDDVGLGDGAAVSCGGLLWVEFDVDAPRGAQAAKRLGGPAVAGGRRVEAVGGEVLAVAVCPGARPARGKPRRGGGDRSRMTSLTAVQAVGHALARCGRAAAAARRPRGRWRSTTRRAVPRAGRRSTCSKFGGEAVDRRGRVVRTTSLAPQITDDQLGPQRERGGELARRPRRRCGRPQRRGSGSASRAAGRPPGR